MRTFITFILVWFVVVDSFSLPDIVEKAEEEILEETKEYNEFSFNSHSHPKILLNQIIVCHHYSQHSYI